MQFHYYCFERNNNADDDNDDNRIREEKEQALQETTQDLDRERELRLLGMHRHQLVIQEDLEQLQHLRHLPGVLEQTQKTLQMAKQDNNILTTALAVENGVQETMSDYMDQAQQELKSLRTKNRVLESERDEAREAHTTLVAAYKELQAYTDLLQRHIINQTAPAGALALGAQERQQLLKQRPKAPFPLGRDWGHGESNVKHHQLPTYSSMVRMRGKSPEEVVAIMMENVKDAEEAFDKGQEEQEQLRCVLVFLCFFFLLLCETDGPICNVCIGTALDAVCWRVAA